MIQNLIFKYNSQISRIFSECLGSLSFWRQISQSFQQYIVPKLLSKTFYALLTRLTPDFQFALDILSFFFRDILDKLFFKEQVLYTCTQCLSSCLPDILTRFNRRQETPSLESYPMCFKRERTLKSTFKVWNYFKSSCTVLTSI